MPSAEVSGLGCTAPPRAQPADRRALADAYALPPEPDFLPQDRRRERRRSMRPEVLAARQVYVRGGASSRYVELSRSLQIRVALTTAVAVLWLGLASYAALAKPLKTIEQRRELARLESLAKTLLTMEGVGDRQSDAHGRGGDRRAALVSAGLRGLAAC